MAVRDGVVVWLGEDAAGRAEFPRADVVDLDGGFVSPGFVDSHVHVTATGLALVGLDLRAATSSEHVLRLVAEYGRGTSAGLIWGHGWDDTRWPQGRPPTTDELDAAVGARPVYLSRVDVHSAVVSGALRRLVSD